MIYQFITVLWNNV